MSRLETYGIRFAWAAVAAALLGVSSWLGEGLNGFRDEMKKKEPSFSESERVHHFDPRLYRILSFGHLPVIVDTLWIRGLQDPIVSTSAVWNEGEHPLIYYTFDLATSLDPLYFDAYTAGANLLAVVRNDARGARDLLVKANGFRKVELPLYPEWFRDRYWGNAWGIPSLLTYLYLYPLRDLNLAAIAIREAAAYPGAPEYLKGLERRLQKPDGLYEIGKILIKVLLARAVEPKVREELERKQDALFVAHSLFQINEAFRTYLGKVRGFHSDVKWPHEKWREHLVGFMREYGPPHGLNGLRDPFGGTLSVDEKGRVRTTTPFEPVFGLEGI